MKEAFLLSSFRILSVTVNTLLCLSTAGQQAGGRDESQLKIRVAQRVRQSFPFRSGGELRHPSEAHVLRTRKNIEQESEKEKSQRCADSKIEWAHEVKWGEAEGEN